MKKLTSTIYRGVKIWYQWDDLHIGQRIALGKYEPYLTNLILEKVNKGDVFVDVGANIGYYSLLAAKKGARVYAIEPEEKNLAVLEKNVKENNLEENIKLVKAGAGEKKGWAEIRKSESNFGAHKLKKGGGKVKIIRLDDLIKEKVNVMKIDVEGMEAEVVKGAQKLIKKWKPTIFFEYGINSRNRKLLDFLSNIYGKIFAIDEYVQFYRLKDIKKLKNFRGNLMVKKNLGWEWGQIKDIQIKKWIKKLERYF